jgi:hypothetical protein
MKNQRNNFRVPVNPGFYSAKGASKKYTMIGCSLILFLMVDVSSGLSPANAISIEVDNEPIITTDRSSSAENTKEQNDLESEKDVEIIYGSSSSVSSSFEDNTATTLSSSSNNPKNQRVPRIQTFTVGQDGTLPSKSK